MRSRSQKTSVVETHEKLHNAMADFLNLLKENDVDDSGTINRQELKDALEKVLFNFYTSP